MKNIRSLGIMLAVFCIEGLLVLAAITTDDSNWDILASLWILVLFVAALYVVMDSIPKSGLNKKMKFTHFKAIYNINPERYHLQPGEVEVYITERQDPSLVMFEVTSTYTIYFSRFDTIRYNRWRKNVTLQKKERIQLKYDQMFLKLVNEDIAAFRKNNPIILE